ncbi:hypothetical protein G6514_009404 [Epicoccum nigrum]|nr:hypothetical protein G6514_009404 [Epicoccum nigrum]
MATSPGSLPGKMKAIFSSRAQDQDAYGVVRELDDFLHNHMNSNILGDSNSVKVDINITTIQPERDFSLCLIQDKPQHTRLRIIAMPRRADGKVYRFSAMEAQEDEGWVSLDTWLGRRVPALTDSFESSAQRLISEYIRLKQVSDFHFWCGSSGMMMSIFAPSAYSRNLAGLLLHYHPMENSSKVFLRRKPKGSEYTEPFTVNNLEVEVQGRWSSLTYLLVEYARKHQGTSYPAIDWWCHIDGQTFRFLDLPAEVRVMVYEKLTGRYVWPRCVAQGSKEICLFHVDSPNDCKVYEKHRPRSYQYWLDPVGSQLP